MSCVAAVVDKGIVWMGGDSAASDGEDMVILNNMKVFFNGPYIIGGVGSLRLTQILQYRFKPPAHPDDDLEGFMATEFTDAVRKSFHDNGFTMNAGPDDQSASNFGAFLVGFRGRIFRVEGDLQIMERSSKFEAIGCGSPYALGYLSQSQGVRPIERVETALRVATSFSAHVRPPYHILGEGDRTDEKTADIPGWA